MSTRPLLFVLIAGLTGVSVAQSGSYFSTFGDYQAWRDGAPADWRAVNRSVAATDTHANHGAPAAGDGHDHGATAGNHDPGNGPSGMADRHGDGKGHDMSVMHGKMHGGSRAGGHDRGTDAGRKP